MTFVRTLSLLAAVAALPLAATAQVITGFGSSETNAFDINTDFKFGWSGTQNATTVSVEDVPNGGGGGIFQTLSAPVFIGEQPRLSLTGITQMVPPGVQNFDIVIYDADASALKASFNWSSFTEGGATVLSDLVVEEGSFDGTVVSWELNLFGAPAGDDVSFTFEELAAVPEPAVVAMIAGAGMVALLLRRRRSSRVS